MPEWRARAAGAGLGAGFQVLRTVALGEPAIGPVRERTDSSFEVPALVCQFILDSDGCLGVDLARDQPFGFELFQPLAEQPVAKAGNARTDIGEPLVALQERPQNSAAPPPAYQFNGVVEEGTERTRVGMHTGILPHVSNLSSA